MNVLCTHDCHDYLEISKSRSMLAACSSATCALTAASVIKAAPQWTHLKPLNPGSKAGSDPKIEDLRITLQR